MVPEISPSFSSYSLFLAYRSGLTVISEKYIAPRFSPFLISLPVLNLSRRIDFLFLPLVVCTTLVDLSKVINSCI